MAGSRPVIARQEIRRLDQVVADAIAAGEVVERPASVVKELCENSIDAGAHAITVDIDSGGLVRIVVADDGCGIAPSQMALAVARHATSKISGIDELASVMSLGFRGEALASITAVADVVIASAEEDAVGATLHVRGGDVVRETSDGRARGTTVEVRDLFFNTPARLRFLRSTRAESAAASRVVGELALAHPDVAFTCRVDSRVTIATRGDGLMAAARAVLGRGAAAELLNVSADGDIAVSGCISEPRAHRGSRTNLVITVNGRRVQNRNLGIAVDEAYRGLIPANRHPYGVIAITLDPHDVDANVHPAKREVRFRNESAVFGAVSRACWHALGSLSVHVGELASAAQSGRTELASRTADLLAFVPSDRRGVAGGGSTDGRDRGADLPVAVAAGRGDDEARVGVADAPDNDSGELLSEVGELTPLGQADGEWIVAWSPGRVVLVDPHAAHEKILYEEILERWRRRDAGERGGDEVQLLLIPAVFDVDPVRLETFEANADWLTNAGFSIDVFGPGVLRCGAVPAASGSADVENLVGEVLDALGPRGDIRAERRHRVAALIACHSAVRFGDRIDPREQAMLLSRLAATRGGLTCPHGRPTVMILHEQSLRRAFGRPTG